MSHESESKIQQHFRIQTIFVLVGKVTWGILTNEGWNRMKYCKTLCIYIYLNTVAITVFGVLQLKDKICIYFLAMEELNLKYKFVWTHNIDKTIKIIFNCKCGCSLNC